MVEPYHREKINKPLLGFLVAIVLSADAFAQTIPKTITEYLLALPPRYFELVHPGFQYEKPKTKAEMDKFRRSRIVIEDVKNGYIKYVESPDESGWSELALFKKTSGGFVLAVARTVVYKGCDTTLDFLEYNKGIWSKVTTKYYPKFTRAMQKKIDNQIFCIALPREGRVLRAYSKWYDEPEEKIGAFEWDGEKLVIRP